MPVVVVEDLVGLEQHGRVKSLSGEVNPRRFVEPQNAFLLLDLPEAGQGGSILVLFCIHLL